MLLPKQSKEKKRKRIWKNGNHSKRKSEREISHEEKDQLRMREKQKHNICLKKSEKSEDKNLKLSTRRKRRKMIKLKVI